MIQITDWFKGWNSGSTVWIWFLISAGLTFFFSKKMVFYASGLISRSKLGSLFVGGVMVSVSTSLPELVTSISQGLNNTPSLGVSDLVGANAFTAVIIALVPLFFIKKRYLSRLNRWTKISIFVAWIIAVSLTLVLWLDKDITIGTPGKYAIGLLPLVYVFVWIAITICNYFYSKKFHTSEAEPQIENVSEFVLKSSTKKLLLGFLLYSGLLLVASLFLNVCVEGMQQIYAIDPKSAGGIFLSMTTAMPEAVSFIIFAREGRPDAAVNSIIGSHIFNISLIFYGDLAYSKNAIFHGPDVQGVWMLSTIVAIQLLILIFHFSYLQKFNKRYIDIGTSISMILPYFVGWILILTI